MNFIDTLIEVMSPTFLPKQRCQEKQVEGNMLKRLHHNWKINFDRTSYTYIRLRDQYFIGNPLNITLTKELFILKKVKALLTKLIKQVCHLIYIWKLGHYTYSSLFSFKFFRNFRQLHKQTKLDHSFCQHFWDCLQKHDSTEMIPKSFNKSFKPYKVMLSYNF